MDYFESQCAHCSKVFTSEKGLKKHKFENHYLIDNAYDCDECGKRFESQVKLKVHTRSHKIRPNQLQFKAWVSLLCGKERPKWQMD